MDLYSDYISAVRGQFLPPSADNFTDYLKDETILKGHASLVLFPSSHEQVRKTLELSIGKAKKANGVCPPEFKLTIRGAGSGLSGGAVPTSGIVVSLEKMDRLISIEDEVLRCEAGRLTSRVTSDAEAAGLRYPVDPSSADVSSIGGNIATNASGPRSLKYGPTSQYVARLRVVWADGQDEWLGSRVLKNSTGPDLCRLWSGSECAFGVITECELRLLPRLAAEEMTLSFVFETEKAALDAVPALRKLPEITAIEFLDQEAIAVNDRWPKEMSSGKAALLCLWEKDSESDELLERISAIFPSNVRIVAPRDARSARNLWAARKGTTETLRKKYAYKIGEDICVPLNQMYAYIQEARAAAASENMDIVIWGHAGQGNLHSNLLFHQAEQQKTAMRLIHKLGEISLSLGGVVSGEHGIGKIKQDLLPLQKSHHEMQVVKQLKKIADPFSIMNH